MIAEHYSSSCKECKARFEKSKSQPTTTQPKQDGILDKLRRIKDIDEH
jgi:hypothetical protein